MGSRGTYKGVNVSDVVYGDIEIADPLLLELVGSAPLQRLKKISQPGYVEPFFPGTDHTRFDHSLGVCHLLGRYKASRAEQAAGLLHDVSHTAFSHCIDYALESGSETKHSFQDDAFLTFFQSSEIPAVLSRHQLDPDYVSESANFPLLETELPDLCADRIDYILRTGIHCNEIDRRKAMQFLDRLMAHENRWVFSDLEAAHEFAKYFALINSKYYSGIGSALMFRSVGDVVRHAVQRKYLSLEALFETDEAVLRRITAHIDDDKELSTLWSRMQNRVSVSQDPKEFNAKVMCKSRAVDPLFLNDGVPCRLSSHKKEWQDILQRESKPKIYFLKYSD
jgi:uncharacterized protein